MWNQLAYMIDRFDPRPAHRPQASRGHDPIVIRRARNGDAPLLHDLAELDCAAPLEGAVLVAVVEERILAALALDDDRAVADPFLPTAAAVELLRLRARQLRTAAGRPSRRLLPRWSARRARA